MQADGVIRSPRHVPQSRCLVRTTLWPDTDDEDLGIVFPSLARRSMGYM